MNHPPSEVLTPQNTGANAKMLDLNSVESHLIYDVRKYSVVTVQAVRAGSTWATAVITVYRSNDLAAKAALESAVTLGPGSSMSPMIDTTAIAYLIVQVTGAEGSAAKAAISVVGT